GRGRARLQRRPDDEETEAPSSGCHGIGDMQRFSYETLTTRPLVAPRRVRSNRGPLRLPADARLDCIEAGVAVEEQPLPVAGDGHVVAVREANEHLSAQR